MMNEGNTKILAAFAAFLFVSANATAATEVYWDAGGADNNWGTQANWSSDTVPNSASYNARFKSHVGDADVVSVTVDGIYEISQFLATPSQNNVKYVFAAPIRAAAARDSGQIMCVGCGRCDIRCPENISFFDTVCELHDEIEKM